MPRSAVASLGLTSKGLNHKVENATLKVYSVLPEVQLSKNNPNGVSTTPQIFNLKIFVN